MFVYSHDCYFATATFPTLLLGINSNPNKIYRNPPWLIFDVCFGRNSELYTYVPHVHKYSRAVRGI